MSASPCAPRARPGPLRVRSPAGRGHAPGAPGSLLPTALGDPGDKRVAGASPRVARGRRERAGLGGARPYSSSFSPLAFASPGLSRASRRPGPAGRDRSRGGGARRWPATPAAAGAASSSCGGRHVPPPHPAPRRGSHAPWKPRPHHPKATSPSRRSRAPTGCTPRITPLPLEATLIYTTSQQSTVKTPTEITMTPRINQYLILKCFRRRYYLPDRGKASGTIFLRGGIQTLSKAS